MALSELVAGAPGSTGEVRRTWWSPRTWERGDRVAVALLASVPALVFVLPALAGHPAVVGDNLLQNFPLRVLTGRELDAGHWPLWNVYADSGTPLLGGMNAGSMYPGTLVFAVLPPLVAWVANLLAVYWVAAAGLFVLARRLGAGPAAAGLAAAAYAYSGAMVGQLVHLGVVQGQALLPWLVLCQLVLAGSVLGAAPGTSVRLVAWRALPATIGLAACLGLVALTGEPRSMADAVVVVLVVALVELVVHGRAALASVRNRVAYAVATVLALTWGAALGFVQLAPGWGFIRLTRRASVSYAFFSMGALPARWLPLLVVPGALGDNGVLGTPRFFAAYNLPEVTGAVGLLAVTAVFAAVAQLCSPHPIASRRRLAAFVALAIAGIALATAPTTPLGPLVHDAPFLGSTRLQSRSIAIFDLGATVLLAWWLDAVLAGRRAEASLTGPRRYVTLAPIALTAALCAAALADPGFLTETVLGVPHSAAVAAGSRGVLAVTLVVALTALVLLWRPTRRPTVAAGAIVAVVLVELVCFNVFFETALVTGINTVEPSAATARATLGTTGRTALVDPGVVAYHETAPIGLGNLNVFTRLPSVQGYGSLHAARYTDATGTARLGELDGCALARGVFAPLRLATVAVSPTGLQASPASDRHPDTCGWPRHVAAATRYFGGRLRVGRVVFAGPASLALRVHDPRVSVLGADGQPRRVPVVLHLGRVLIASFPTQPEAAAVVLRSSWAFQLASTRLTVARGPTVLLDTAMQVALDRPAWRFLGVRGTLSVFRATRVAPAVWLVHPARGDAAHLVAATEDGAATVAVTARSPVRLVRSETWLPGWGATLVANGSTATRAVAVVPDGLVQSVAVPAGTWRVEFGYHAPHLRLGIDGHGDRARRAPRCARRPRDRSSAGSRHRDGADVDAAERDRRGSVGSRRATRGGRGCRRGDGCARLCRRRRGRRPRARRARRPARGHPGEWRGVGDVDRDARPRARRRRRRLHPGRRRPTHARLGDGEQEGRRHRDERAHRRGPRRSRRRGGSALGSSSSPTSRWAPSCSSGSRSRQRRTSRASR